MIDDVAFAVMDVETTGLFPNRHDRIIEIAVIRIDPSGKVLDEYATLVNPQRDLGPTGVHGILAQDVMHAPVFEEIAGDVIALLPHAVLVGHNVRFDIRFLDAELNRVGCRLPDVPCLCTMRLVWQADPHIPSRKLDVVCDHFAIPRDAAHTAYGDACATANLLTKCFALLGGAGEIPLSALGVEGKPPPRSCWPVLPVTGKSYSRHQAARATSFEPGYIPRLVSKLPSGSTSSPEIDEYLSLLDRALEDRRLTREEADELFVLAHDLGMDREQAEFAHFLYMRDLTRVALEDGVVTEVEKRDLQNVGCILGFSDDRLAVLLTKAREERETSGVVADVNVMGRGAIEGKSICFTGTLTCRVKGEPVSRKLAEQCAREQGMTIRKNVTKSLDYLVAADPDSMSGKAKKARQYGVRVIAEPVFWGMLGVPVE